ERAAAPLRRRCRGDTRLIRRSASEVVLLQAIGADDANADAGLPVESGTWVLAGDVRLDDRQALRGRLRDREPDLPMDAPDAALLAAALHAWGARAADHLVGDFAFIALDRGAGML